MLTVAGVGYLIVVLALAAVTLDLDTGHQSSVSRLPAANATTGGQGDDGAAALPPSPVTPAGGDVRVGSAQSRPATPPA
ncbi:hypothetical protein DKT69_31305, partial [Micromonospora sicca]